MDIEGNGERKMEINHLRYEPLAEYSVVFGREISDADLIELISGIGCQKAIAILSHFSSLHIAVCHQNCEAIYLDWQLRILHSNHIKEIGGNWLQYNRFGAIMCPQSIFTLEKWVLVYCPVEKEYSPITIPDLMLIMDALIAINDRLPKEGVDGHETEYLYLTLYHNTHKSTKDQIARSFYVFCNLIETCPDELPEILITWFKAQRRDIRSAVVLANFLPSCGKQYVCSKYVSTLFKDSLREISLRTFGKNLSSKLEL